MQVIFHKACVIQPEQTVKIFCDASYDQNWATKRQKKPTSKLMCLGWVIQQEFSEDLFRKEISEDLKTGYLSNYAKIRANNRSNVGEICAAIHALNSLPPDCTISLHSDHNDTVELINTQSRDNIDPYNRYTELWDKLEQALSRHTQVNATKAKDDDNEPNVETRRAMIIAHNLAISLIDYRPIKNVKTMIGPYAASYHQEIFKGRTDIPQEPEP